MSTARTGMSETTSIKKDEETTTSADLRKQESPANAKGTRDSSAYMKAVKAHCEQM